MNDDLAELIVWAVAPFALLIFLAIFERKDRR